MKNLKKISREQLKEVQGGSGVPTCPVGYIYLCSAEGICDDNAGQYECICQCAPIGTIPNS